MGPSTGRSAWTVREVPGPQRRGGRGRAPRGGGGEGLPDPTPLPAFSSPSPLPGRQLHGDAAWTLPTPNPVASPPLPTPAGGCFPGHRDSGEDRGGDPPARLMGRGGGRRGAEAPGCVSLGKKKKKKGAGVPGQEGRGGLLGAAGASGRRCMWWNPPVPLPSAAGRAGPRAARAGPGAVRGAGAAAARQTKGGGEWGETRRASPGWEGEGGMRAFMWALPPTPPPRGAYGHPPPPGMSDSAPHPNGRRLLAPLFEPLGRGEGTHPPSLSCAPPKTESWWGDAPLPLSPLPLGLLRGKGSVSEEA